MILIKGNFERTQVWSVVISSAPQSLQNLFWAQKCVDSDLELICAMIAQNFGQSSNFGLISDHLRETIQPHN